MNDPESEPPDPGIPDPHRLCEITDVHCIKLLTFVVICYTVINNEDTSQVEQDLILQCASLDPFTKRLSDFPN